MGLCAYELKCFIQPCEYSNILYIAVRDRSLNMGGGGPEDFVKFSAKKQVASPSILRKIQWPPLQTSRKNR